MKWNSFVTLCFLFGIQLTLSQRLSTHEFHYGYWSDWHQCEEHTFVNSFDIKVDHGGGLFYDDKGLTGIKLFCSYADGQDGSILAPKEANSGSWMYHRMSCSYGWAVGFTARVESYRGVWRDDSAVNNFKMLCSSGQRLNGRGTNMGAWEAWKYCPDGEFICKVRTKLEGSYVINPDKVGVISIEIGCCSRITTTTSTTTSTTTTTEPSTTTTTITTTFTTTTTRPSTTTLTISTTSQPTTSKEPLKFSESFIINVITTTSPSSTKSSPKIGQEFPNTIEENEIDTKIVNDSSFQSRERADRDQSDKNVPIHFPEEISKKPPAVPTTQKPDDQFIFPILPEFTISEQENRLNHEADDKGNDFDNMIPSDIPIFNNTFFEVTDELPLFESHDFDNLGTNLDEKIDYHIGNPQTTNNKEGSAIDTTQNEIPTRHIDELDNSNDRNISISFGYTVDSTELEFPKTDTSVNKESTHTQTPNENDNGGRNLYDDSHQDGEGVNRKSVDFPDSEFDGNEKVENPISNESESKKTDNKYPLHDKDTHTDSDVSSTSHSDGKGEDEENDPKDSTRVKINFPEEGDLNQDSDSGTQLIHKNSTFYDDNLTQNNNRVQNNGGNPQSGMNDVLIPTDNARNFNEKHNNAGSKTDSNNSINDSQLLNEFESSNDNDLVLNNIPIDGKNLIDNAHSVGENVSNLFPITTEIPNNNNVGSLGHNFKFNNVPSLKKNNDSLSSPTFGEENIKFNTIPLQSDGGGNISDSEDGNFNFKQNKSQNFPPSEKEKDGKNDDTDENNDHIKESDRPSNINVIRKSINSSINTNSDSHNNTVNSEGEEKISSGDTSNNSHDIIEIPDEIPPKDTIYRSVYSNAVNEFDYYDGSSLSVGLKYHPTAPTSLKGTNNDRIEGSEFTNQTVPDNSLIPDMSARPQNGNERNEPSENESSTEDGKNIIHNNNEENGVNWNSAGKTDSNDAPSKENPNGVNIITRKYIPNANKPRNKKEGKTIIKGDSVNNNKLNGTKSDIPPNRDKVIENNIKENDINIKKVITFNNDEHIKSENGIESKFETQGNKRNPDIGDSKKETDYLGNKPIDSSKKLIPENGILTEIPKIFPNEGNSLVNGTEHLTNSMNQFLKATIPKEEVTIEEDFSSVPFFSFVFIVTVVLVASLSIGGYRLKKRIALKRRRRRMHPSWKYVIRVKQVHPINS